MSFSFCFPFRKWQQTNNHKSIVSCCQFGDSGYPLCYHQVRHVILLKSCAISLIFWIRCYHNVMNTIALKLYDYITFFHMKLVTIVLRFVLHIKYRYIYFFAFAWLIQNTIFHWRTKTELNTNIYNLPSEDFGGNQRSYDEHIHLEEMYSTVEEADYNHMPRCSGDHVVNNNTEAEDLGEYDVLRGKNQN